MFVEGRVKRAAAARNMTLSLAEELQAALTAQPSQHHPAHEQHARAGVDHHLRAGVDQVARCAAGGGGIAQFLVDVAQLGSPDQVDPVNKFRGVVCDLAYGCVVDHADACTKSCCGADQLLPPPPATTTSTSGHVCADVIGDDSDSSTLLSTSRDGSDVTVTSSCGSRAASVSGASDAGYVPSDESRDESRDEVEGKKLLLSHFDRTTSLDSSRKCQPFTLCFLTDIFALLVRRN